MVATFHLMPLDYQSQSRELPHCSKALPSMLIVRRRTDYGTVEAIDGPPRVSADVPQESGTWLATTLKFTVNEALAARPVATTIQVDSLFLQVNGRCTRDDCR